MPIISAENIEKCIYRIAITVGHGMVENMVISDDGLYDIYYLKDGKVINNTGRIVNVVQNRALPKNSYILFDCSEDNSNKRERVHFYQVQAIKDITPNDAYRIALDHGFVGTVNDWLESLHGEPGKDAYEIAVECGYNGTREEWLESLRGSRGYSAYEIATQNGFEGTEEEWLKSLKAESPYEIAIRNGFVGSEADWLLSLKGENGESAYQIAIECGFEGTKEQWLESLKGQSAYEYAVEHGFEGTQEEWYMKNGDVTVVNAKVEQVVNSMSWKEGM